ncbi:MAG: TMEM165/GDT1 family protein [Actinobacteria bacterium]|nr:MAG: TMEM165/GDT1 family protein [Actinomycetota bacterium]
MADKTQLLAMAFACRYRPASVLTGVFVATVLNHALAVAAGNYLGNALDVTLVQSVAGVSFIVFGLWTLRGDRLEGEERRKTRFGFAPAHRAQSAPAACPYRRRSLACSRVAAKPEAAGVRGRVDKTAYRSERAQPPCGSVGGCGERAMYY